MTAHSDPAGKRRHLFGKRFRNGDLGALLAEPWHRLGRMVRGLRRRLGQPARAGAAPLVTAPTVVIAVAALVAILILLPLDGEISRAMLTEPPGVHAFFGYATDAGLSGWYLIPTIALMILISFADWGSFTRVGRVRVANVYAHVAFLFTAVAGAGILVNILKVLFGRARPILIDEGGSLAFHFLTFGHRYASFPSGHSTTMGAVTATLMIWFPGLRVPIAATGLAIALSRVVVRAHYPSDVVSGFTLGALTAILFARWLARRHVFYGFVKAGRGWAGLIPVRADRSRDVDRSVVRELGAGLRLRRARRPDEAPQSPQSPDRDRARGRRRPRARSAGG